LGVGSWKAHAGEWAAAAAHFERAARVLTNRSSFREAGLLLDRGLAALARVRDRRAVAPQEIACGWRFAARV
jgi:hypothetical protein